MKTITWTRGTETGTKRVHDWAYSQMVATLRHTGYTIVDETPAVAPAPAQASTEQTGRVGKGREVHRIAAGHTVCGASYRRNNLGSTVRQVRITGETATCGNCR